MRNFNSIDTFVVNRGASPAVIKREADRISASDKLFVPTVILSKIHQESTSCRQGTLHQAN